MWCWGKHVNWGSSDVGGWRRWTGMSTLDATGTVVLVAAPIGLFRPISAPRAVKEILSPTVTPRIQPALQHRRLWERRYARLLGLTDVTIVLLVVGLTGWLTLLLAPAGAAATLHVARTTAM